MRNIFLISLFLFVGIFTDLSAQNYNITYFPNAGNPGGLNTDNDGHTSTWTLLIGGSKTANSWSSNVAIPFAFDFYESPVTHLKVSGNGVITFDTTAILLPANDNTNLPAPPSASVPDKSILAFWNSFTTDPPTYPESYVLYKTFGTAPNRQFWIKYHSYDIENTFGFWAVVLEEGTNAIYVVNMGYHAAGATSTLGLQLNNSNAVQYGDSTLSPQIGSSTITADNAYFKFTPSLLDDAALGKLITPSKPFTSGLQPVTVELVNVGKNTINSATINWKMNEILQTPFYFSGSLYVNEVIAVPLGNYNFPVGNTSIALWVSDPNGNQDSNTLNDSLFYNPCVGLSGTYSIAASGADFIDINDAVDRLKTCGVVGPVVFNVENGTYSGAISIPEILGADSINTITFQGASRENTIITYDGSGTQNSTLELDGADYITFRNFTMKNTKSTSQIWIVHFINEADHNTLDSCNILHSQNSYIGERFGIAFGGSKTYLFTPGNNANYTTIKNCKIVGAKTGILMYGGTFTGNANYANTIYNCFIFNVSHRGIDAFKQEELTIEKNKLYNFNAQTPMRGINILQGGPYRVRKNKISISNGYGIYLRNVETQNDFFNNMIYSPGGQGIYSNNTVNGKIYFNTILAKDQALTCTSTSSTTAMQNNIFASETTEAFNSTVFQYGSYNLFYSSNATLIKVGGINYPNVSGYYNATGQEQFSRSGNPLIEKYDFGTYLQVTSNVIDEKGFNWYGVTDDINDNSRIGTYQDIGAEEITFNSCPKPSSLTISNFTGSEVDLHWNGGTSNSWQVEWNADSDFIPGRGQSEFSNTVSDSSLNINSLAPNTTYYAYVRTDCGVNKSFWIGPVVFQTPCNVVSTYPYLEAFESISNFCWRHSPDNTENWVLASTAANGAAIDHTSGNGLFLYLNDAAPHATSDVGFELPSFDLTSLSSPVLTFWFQNYRGANSTTRLSNLYIDVFDGNSWHTDVFIIENQSINTWTEYGFNLSQFISTNTKIRFRGRENPSYSISYVSIDDIKIENNLACNTPSNLAVSAIDFDKAVLTWTRGLYEIEWELEYGPAGFTQGTGTLMNLNSQSATLSNLTRNTTYDCYVRAKCSPGNSSAWSTVLTFRTGQCEVSSSTNFHYINNFTASGIWENIANLSSGYSTIGYGDFYTQSVDIYDGEVLTFSSSLSTGAAGFNIWVDWNRDMDFDDAGEKVFSTSTPGISPTGSFTIPANTPAGSYSMRVRSDASSSDPPACGTSSGFDETEDYTINVYNCSMPMVLNTNDNGCGSLRDVVLQATAGDTIRFSKYINANNINLTNGQILIDKNLTMIGNGRDSTIIDGQSLSRLFEVALNTSFNIDSICIQNGDISSSGGVAGQGGAIFVSGRLHVSNSLFQGNKAQIGGAFMAPANGTADIFIEKCTFRNNQSTIQGGVIGFGSDTLSIQNSTFSGNVSNDDAGVIRSISADKVLLTSSTFSGNTASASTGLGGVMRDNSSSVEVNSCTFYNNTAQQGGAFYLETNDFSIRNSILKNTASSIGQDFNLPSYTLSDLGYNLVYSTDGNHGIIDGNGIDPRLDVLADNGGPTQTHALLCGSPAQNAGTGTLPDQRGIAVFDGIKDIGAFEREVNVNQIENNNITTGPQQFGAEGVLQSSSKITSPQLIEFTAGKAVILEQGFEAASGSVFSAKIVNGCP